MSEIAIKDTPRPLRDRTVSIIGAGPAGLTLARLLQMRGAAVRVFERDTSRAVRGQGGSLDLHEDSGQLALRSAGLMDRFQAAARPDGQHTRILDRHGVLSAELLAEYEPQSRPEIDRGVLRDLLLDSLAPDTVIWDRQLLRVDRTEAARSLLVFKNAAAVEADLVVGCDGGWSKVRPLRSDLMPHYSGVTFVQTWVADADRRHPDLSSFVGPGNVMALGDNKALMAQRNGDGHIRIYAGLRVPEDWTRNCGIDLTDLGATRTGLLALFDGWAEPLLAMLRLADPVFQPWPLFTCPSNQSWRPQPDVTLLGDAAHIMPPFTGKGANYAMLDALELSDCLTSNRFADVASALASYEAAMLARMSPAIEESLASQDLLISPEAPANVAQFLAHGVA
jgi:2-polyprenyl-6-methoxyphenol hydroxylase-like FAD-dependent oxidoreductase